MLTPLQKLAAQAIVNIFETGAARGRYGQVTVLPGDTGHLTYGRAQTTLGSGNLYVLIKSYCGTPGALHTDELSQYLDGLQRRDTTLDTDETLQAILRAAGGDPVMQGAQDAFFDRAFWTPATRAADLIGATTALGTAIIYDGHIQGAWQLMFDRTNGRHGRLQDIGEETWFAFYVDGRRNWLANHSNPALHPTVYRMDSFKQLMAEGKWDLSLPFTVRGVTVDENALAAPPAASADTRSSPRALKLAQPFLRGDDVRALQQALRTAGIEVDVDGDFGPATERAVKDFQAREGLTADGVAGPATRAALGL